MLLNNLRNTRRTRDRTLVLQPVVGAAAAVDSLAGAGGLWDLAARSRFKQEVL